MDITLKTKLKINGKETNKVPFDETKLNGNSLMAAEKMARTLGDETPLVLFSQTYMVCVATKAMPLSYKEISELPGKDYMAILQVVSNFLYQ